MTRDEIIDELTRRLGIERDECSELYHRLDIDSLINQYRKPKRRIFA